MHAICSLLTCFTVDGGFAERKWRPVANVIAENCMHYTGMRNLLSVAITKIRYVKLIFCKRHLGNPKFTLLLGCIINALVMSRENGATKLAQTVKWHFF